MPVNLEIERKFVVNPLHPEWIALKESVKGQKLIQTTIHKEDGYKLRIRMIEDLETGTRSSFFCFKVNKKGAKHDPAMRDEYEWEVPDRTALYMMIGHGEITKIRRPYVHTDGLTYEIDEYQGQNEGIITADVEVEDASHTFEKPAFLGWEVTNDSRLKNSTLQNEEKSYKTWSPEDTAWYATLAIGDGVSASSEKDKTEKKISPVTSSESLEAGTMAPVSEKKEKKSFWKRLRKAWKIVFGKDE